MARLKVNSEMGEAVYHVMTRTVNGERLLDDVAKEVLRKQLWLTAEFCGVEILTFSLLSNHFHVLVRVPQRGLVDGRELLRRYRLLHPKPTKYQAAKLEAVADQLKKGGVDGEAWRTRQMALMGDVSQFMKLLKQRFTIWFNRSHGRFGTLWAERFKSVLVEGKSGALATMAAYIDLNAVRAGLVDDPKDYRFCGYAEAVAGHRRALAGIAAVTGAGGAKALPYYRQMLFGTGTREKQGKGSTTLHRLQEVVRNRGQLPLADVLRCRIRHFSDGAVLGSQAFVQEQLGHYRRSTGRRRSSTPRELPQITDWGGLMTMRGLRWQPSE
jgi:REP element-mobilizing transposase RayT